jgi:hypothetical protein
MGHGENSRGQNTIRQKLPRATAGLHETSLQQSCATRLGQLSESRSGRDRVNRDSAASVTTDEPIINETRCRRAGFFFLPILIILAAGCLSLISPPITPGAQIPPISVVSRGADGADGFIAVLNSHPDGFAGGAGGPVSAALPGTDFISSGIFPQSVGSSSSFLFAGFSLGVKGGSGGAGGEVKVSSRDATINTAGDWSYGIFAQSVGGGGGNAKFSLAGTLGGGIATTATIGGSGGGGNGKSVTVRSNGALIETFGDRATGILGQIIGGGGGNGSFRIGVSGG